MDQFYVDSAYWDAYYATYQAEAEIGLGPYFASDYFEGDYFENTGIQFTMAVTAIKVKDCSASLVAESSVVCDATKIAGGVAVFGYSDVQSFATMSATISHIHGSDMFAFGEAALSAQVDRIRSINLDASATFSTAIDAVRGIYVSAQSDSAFDIAIANLRVRNTEAAVDAAFSLTADASASGSTAADLSSEFTQTVSADKLVPGSADLTDSLALTASIDGTLEAAGAITSSSTVSATISHIHGADLSAFGNASLGANFDRIRNFDSQLDVQNQLDAVVDKIQQGAADLSSEFTIIMVTGMFQQGAADLTGAFSPVVTCQVTTNTFAVLEAASSLSADANQITSLSSSIDASSSATVDNSRVRNLDISIDANSSLDATAINLQGFDAGITSSTSLSATIGSIELFEISITATLGIDATVGIIKQFASEENSLFEPNFTCNAINNTFAVLEAQTSLSTNPVRTVSAQASLSASSTTVVDAKKLNATQISISSSFTASTTARKVRFLSSTIGASATVNATGKSFKRARGTFSTVSSILASPTVIEKYWANEVVSTDSVEFYGPGVMGAVAGSQGYIFATSMSQTASDASPYNDPLLYKYTNNGQLVWVKEYQTTSVSIADLSRPVVDSQGNIINAYQLSATPGASTSDFLLIKWTSEGLVSWARKIDDGNFDSLRGTVAVDSQDNIYFTGRAVDPGLGNSVVYKYNSAGTRQWAITSDNFGSITNIAFLGNDIILQGSSIGSGSSAGTLVARLSTSTNPPSILTWGNRLIDDTTNETLTKYTGIRDGLAVDSQDNVYSLGALNSSPSGVNNWSIYLSKYSSSGVLAWQKIYNTETPDLVLSHGYALHIDSSDSLYVGSRNGLIIKLDSDGAVIWSREIRKSGVTASIYSITESSNGHLLLGTDLGVIKLPIDGSRTGSYSNAWVYQSINVTANTAVISIDNPSLIALTTSSLTQTTASLTVDTKTTYTQTFTDFTLVQASAAITARATVYCRLNKTASARSTISSVSTVSKALMTKVTTMSSNMQATASLTASLRQTKRTSVGLASSATLVANNARYRATSASIQATFTEVSTVKKTARTGSVITAQASLTANDYNFTKASAQINSQFTAVANILRIKGTSANLQVTGSEVTIAYLVGQGLIHTDIVASISCSAEKTTDISLDLAANTEQATVITKTTDYSASLTAQTALTAGIDYLRRNEVIATASSSQVSTAVKTARTGSTVAATASLTALTDNSRIVRVNAALTAQAGLTAENDTLRRTAADLTATSEVNLIPGVFIRTEAHLEVAGFVLAAGRKISFDRYLQLTIKPENRGLVVLQESRALTIDSETRLNIIKGYPL